MYKLCFFVPPEYAEQVKKTIFKTGAGQLGEYAECCWQTMGVGQFRPLENSRPFLGEANKLEKVEELKVEMLCADNLIHKAISAMKQAHPYEEPAYEVFRLESF